MKTYSAAGWVSAACRGAAGTTAPPSRVKASSCLSLCQLLQHLAQLPDHLLKAGPLRRPLRPTAPAVGSGAGRGGGGAGGGWCHTFAACSAAAGLLPAPLQCRFAASKRKGSAPHQDDVVIQAGKPIGVGAWQLIARRHLFGRGAVTRQAETKPSRRRRRGALGATAHTETFVRRRSGAVGLRGSAAPAMITRPCLTSRRCPSTSLPTSIQWLACGQGVCSVTARGGSRRGGGREASWA